MSEASDRFRRFIDLINNLAEFWVKNAVKKDKLKMCFIRPQSASSL